MNHDGQASWATPFCERVRVRPSRAGAGLMIAGAAALAVLAAGCASSAGRAASSAPSAASSAVTTQHATSPAGAIQFPPSLFGFGQDTSAQAQKLDQNMAQMLAMMGMFAHPHVALYGSMETGDMFIVGVTDLTTAAQKYSQPISAASLRTGFLAQGAQDIQSFPAGAPGVVLGCGHVTRAGITEILCLRYSKTIIGMAVYLNGSASSLSDAAAKTSHAIAAIGG